MEAEETVSAGTEPLAQILGIGYGRTKGNDADLALNLRRDVPHA